MKPLIKIIDTTGEPDTLGRLIDNYNMQHQLKTLRQQAGLTQSELAELANVSAVTICHVEQGKANVSLATLAKIATALHATVRVKIEPLITKAEAGN